MKIIIVNRYHQPIFTIENTNQINLPDNIDDFYLGKMEIVESFEGNQTLFLERIDDFSWSGLEVLAKRIGLGQVGKCKPVNYDSRMKVGIFNANNSGGRGRGKFLCIMNLLDAKKFCSDGRSKGKSSMFVFTQVDPCIIKASSFLKDDGRYLEVWQELGIESIKYWEDINIYDDFVKYLGKPQ